MKKVLLVILAVAILVLCACSCSAEKPNKPAATPYINEQGQQVDIGGNGDEVISDGDIYHTENSVNGELFKLTVTKTERKGYLETDREGMVDTPEGYPDNEYIIVYLTAENISKETQYFSTPSFLRAFLGNEEVLEEPVNSDVINGVKWIEGDVNPGESITGYVAYAIPKETEEHFYIVYADEFAIEGSSGFKFELS